MNEGDEWMEYECPILPPSLKYPHTILFIVGMENCIPLQPPLQPTTQKNQKRNLLTDMYFVLYIS